MTATAFAAAATVVATAFALVTAERWLARRRPHELAWTVALGLFAVASAALWAGVATGWDETNFRIFYLFGAVLNVPYLALGTVYLLAGRQAANRVGVGVVLFSFFAAGVVLVAPLDQAVASEGLPAGSDLFGTLPRVLAAAASGIAATVVVAGALWSAARKNRQLAANAFIAVGTVVAGSKSLFAFSGETTAFALALTTGVTLIFAGFLIAAVSPKRRRIE